MSDFNTAVNILFKHEGGYAHNPNDPGGETKYGISKRQYPDLDIKNLTKEQAAQIYFNDYWVKNKLDGLWNQQIANFALDTVVQHGKGPKLIQEALNKSGMNVTVDNKIGSKTIDAMNHVDVKTFIQQGVLTRRAYYDSLIKNNPTLEQFRRGWYRRVNYFLGDWKLPVVGGGIVLVLAGLYFWFTRTK
jgi:lysozyme family protein